MKNLKTPEDEAFDELAQRQGMWGGGFHAKRAAAADKLHWSDCAVHNGPAYPAGECDCGAAQDGKCKYCVDGCIACDARAQPAQRPWVGLTAEDFSAIKFPAEMRFPAEFRAGARWADTKLKEKNT
jgi:hypothetical protein